MKISSISATLLEVSSIARITAPPVGILIVNVGFRSVKSTPFEMRSCLLDISSGAVLTEFVIISVSIYSTSSQILLVVVSCVVGVVLELEEAVP